MSRLHPFPDGENAVNTNQKTTVDANPGSNNITDGEQQLSNTQKGHLDQAITRLSNRRTLIQAALTTPSFAVELNNSITYLNQCPIQPLINVFLIVHGCSSLVNGIVLIMGFFTAKYILQSPTPSPCARRLIAVNLIGQLVYLLFSVAWLVVGQVWIFGAQRNGFQSTNSTQTATYCHPTVFWTGFDVIIVTYAIWLIIILVLVWQFIKKRHRIKQWSDSKADENSWRKISYLEVTTFNCQ